MLRLLLMRHAKSSRSEQFPEDRMRPLNNRGIAAARKMGRALASRDLVPELILCSPAVRTRMTLDLMLPELGQTPPVQYREELYNFADGLSYLKCIQNEGSDCPNLMLIGHNPSIQNLALMLAKDDADSRYFSAMRNKFPTAAVAVFSVPIATWRHAEPGTGTPELFLRPAELDEDG